MRTKLLYKFLFFRGTLDVGIIFSGSTLNLHTFSDIDWVTDLDSMRSTTGYILNAAEGPILWNFKLQSTVTASTMEAEYIAAFRVVQECMWIKGVLGEMNLTIDSITLYMDRESEI